MKLHYIHNEQQLTSQGGSMTKLISIPRSQIMDTPSEMLLLIVGQSGHRLSHACKRDIAAVIKARNNSKNQA
jgi:hypothetical protein